MSSQTTFCSHSLLKCYDTNSFQREIGEPDSCELQKDKQRIIFESILKGQEEERSRLAEDLHDGLGGMLHCVKYSLLKMKGTRGITADNNSVLERSLLMLDYSITELRRMAHNMMPVSLARFGLDEALKDYCDSINNSDILKVKYQSFHLNKRFDNNSEVNIYRIIQELLNNTVKHAKASEALVQLLRAENRLNITVEDNGKGFDYNNLCNKKGTGLLNIRNRVALLKGKIDFQSEQEKGTSVFIEFDI